LELIKQPTFNNQSTTQAFPSLIPTDPNQSINSSKLIIF